MSSANSILNLSNQDSPSQKSSPPNLPLPHTHNRDISTTQQLQHPHESLPAKEISVPNSPTSKTLSPTVIPPTQGPVRYSYQTLPYSLQPPIKNRQTDRPKKNKTYSPSAPLLPCPANPTSSTPPLLQLKKTFAYASNITQISPSPPSPTFHTSRQKHRPKNHKELTKISETHGRTLTLRPCHTATGGFSHIRRLSPPPGPPR